jgi:hypothetical protein
MLSAHNQREFWATVRVRQGNSQRNRRMDDVLFDSSCLGLSIACAQLHDIDVWLCEIQVILQRWQTGILVKIRIVRMFHYAPLLYLTARTINSSRAILSVTRVVWPRASSRRPDVRTL